MIKVDLRQHGHDRTLNLGVNPYRIVLLYRKLGLIDVLVVIKIISDTAAELVHSNHKISLELIADRGFF
jgi:hypothetical protein